MGLVVAFVGVASLIVGAVGRFGPALRVPGFGTRGAGQLIGLGLVALLVGVLIAKVPDSPQEQPVQAAADRTDLTLRAYLRTNAPAEAVSVVEYLPAADRSSLVVRTNLASVPDSLAAARRICELARNVIADVRVDAPDGSALWTCDRVESDGNPALVSLAARQAAEAAQTEADLEAAARAESERLTQQEAAAAAARQRAARQAQADQRARAAQPVPVPTPGCHPSYEGECLPAGATDVDCLDGGGNGPVYTKTHDIRVVGPDQYGLDSDDDKIACESEKAGDGGDSTPAPSPDDDDPEEPEVPEEPSPPPTSRCHSSYQGECLPVDAVDVDCAGGSGDGPVYAQTKNIKVVGQDVYELDSDGDGFGCDA